MRLFKSAYGCPKNIHFQGVQYLSNWKAHNTII